MNKAELYDKLESMMIDDRMILALTNYFSSTELEEFTEFLEEEGF